MMKVVRYPEKSTWDALLKRPAQNNFKVVNAVKNILTQVQQKGDEAIREYCLKFDGFAPDDLFVSEQEFYNAETQVSDDLKNAIQVATINIRKYHQAQLNTTAVVIETMSGIQCWQKTLPIEKVGLYIPGGTAPLFSTVLMLGIPAQIAGCKEIILCTPADKNGNINPMILYTAKQVGIKNIYKIGGAQAIAAMAYGTETIPQVYKIFGPGNQYVTTAKQLVQAEGVAIDMPAGPSEVCVIADESANAGFTAADLLSQAEHGIDSQVVLITTSEYLLNQVMVELQNQLYVILRKEIATKALQNSIAVLVKSIEDAVELSNSYAPEHLIVCCNDFDDVSNNVTNAGSVFLGNYSPESAGDYASGTNHTLPTSGYAKAYSGVSVDSFMRKISFQKLSQQGLQNIGKTIIDMAEAEGLQAHAEAVKVRLQNQ
jgi:histidinol dehydrogenase